MESGQLDRVSKDVIRPFYAERQSIAKRILNEELGSNLPWRLHEADGGMFSWLWIDHPRFCDMTLYEAMKRQSIYIMPGRHFFVDPDRLPNHATRCFRLSVAGDDTALRLGVARLAETVKSLLR